MLNAILGLKCHDMRRICESLTKLTAASSLPPSLPELSTLTIPSQALNSVYSNTIDIGTKEASGRPLLALFMDTLRNALQLKYSHVQLLVDHEYKILEAKRYACDVAVIIAGIKREVLFAVEYKPGVPTDFKDITPWHLSETLLQAYYMRDKFQYDIVHCLTDMSDYHYFLVGSSDEKKFVIKKHWYKPLNLTDEAAFMEHLNFVCNIICMPEIHT